MVGGIGMLVGCGCGLKLRLRRRMMEGMEDAMLGRSCC